VLEHDGHEEESISPYTKDGSIDCYGKPAVKARTGGWRSASLLLGIHTNLDIHVVFELEDIRTDKVNRKSASLSIGSFAAESRSLRTWLNRSWFNRFGFFNIF
jgi:hypothetical protein